MKIFALWFGAGDCAIGVAKLRRILAMPMHWLQSVTLRKVLKILRIVYRHLLRILLAIQLTCRPDDISPLAAFPYSVVTSETFQNFQETARSPLPREIFLTPL